MITKSQSSLTPLQQLNKEFRRQYIRARDNFWLSETENNSVIIEDRSSLTLIHKGNRYSVSKSITQS
jgi:hypothetical protein